MAFGVSSIGFQQTGKGTKKHTAENGQPNQFRKYANDE
jgi:hypothetical protein